MCAQSKDSESVQITPAMIEAGLEVITERWRDWPYGECRVSLMLADVFRAMRIAHMREERFSNLVTQRENLIGFASEQI
jgi:hypothetical protein